MASSGLKVLVIDDDTTLQVLAKDYLSSAGYIVRVAEDGAKGRKFAESFSPDIILLDLIMPNCDGYELCAELKSNSSTSAIPVVLMTGSREPDVIQRGLQVGATDFVTKPVDWEFLGDRVAHVLNQQASNAGSDASQVARSTDAADGAATQRLARVENENTELKSAVAAAQVHISELNDKLASTQAIAPADPQHTVTEVHAQISKIEQEWSDRLQQAVALANSRADQTIAGLQAQLEAKTDEITNLNAGLETAQTNAAAAAETRIKEQHQELENVRQAELAAVREAELQKQLEIEQTHQAEVSEIWQFVDRATVEYRAALRRSQATMSEVQKLLVAGSDSEVVSDAVDVLTTQMVNNLRSVAQLNELARLSFQENSSDDRETFELCGLIEDCVGETRNRLGRTDIVFTNAVDPTVRITAGEHRVKRAFSHLIEYVARCAPPDGSVQVNAETATDGSTTLKLVNLGSGVAFGQEAEALCGTEQDVLPRSAEGWKIGLWIAKGILRDSNASIRAENLPGLGTAIAVCFGEQASPRVEDMPGEPELAIAV